MLAIEFEQIVHDHQHRLFVVAQRIVHSREDAEEIAQDALVQAFRALMAMSPENRSSLRIRGWLSTITINAARRRLRQQRLPLVSLDALRNPDRLIPHQHDCGSFDLEMIEHALLEMPREMQTAARLRFLEDRTNPEIAEILHKPLGTVKCNVHRAAHRMRVILAAQLAAA